MEWKGKFSRSECAARAEKSVRGEALDAKSTFESSLREGEKEARVTVKFGQGCSALIWRKESLFGRADDNLFLFDLFFL